MEACGSDLSTVMLYTFLTDLRTLVVTFPEALYIVKVTEIGAPQTKL